MGLGASTDLNSQIPCSTIETCSVKLRSPFVLYYINACTVKYRHEARQ